MKYILILILLFSACASAPKESVDIIVTEDQKQINFEKLEAVIIPLEAMGGNEARRQESEMASARDMINELLLDAADNNEAQGKIIAWSGRLAILEGRYSEAIRLYRQSQELSSGNVPAVILGIRLEGDPGMRLRLIEKELETSGQKGFGELQIEKGRTLLEMGRYLDAAQAFDSAFASGLAEVYRENY
ncbi:MAG: hypothetical protein LBH16_00685 [Treponema sp.]|jgi:tetratricopeptide (TPR) repeat protein|nr:hypothetical protein [Treponema sp.]